MKIAINLLPHRNYQGIEIYTRNLVSALQKIPNIELLLIKYSDSPSHLDFSGENITNEVINVKDLKKIKFARKIRLAILQQRKISSIARRIKPDFLLCTSPYAPLFYRKAVVTIHDCAYDIFPEFGFLGNLYFKLIYFNAKHFARMIITDSEFSKSELIRRYHISPKKIKVIHLAAPRLPKEDKESIRKFKLGDTKYFIYIGSTRPRKNIKGMVGAFKIFTEKNPGYKLVIVGRKDDTFFNLDEHIGKLNLQDKVLRTDFVTDTEKVALIKNAVAVVFVSFYEGFGLPALESQVLGTPLLASNKPSLPEVAGEGAYFVDPYDIQEIARGMEKIATDKKLRNKVADEGYENVKRFSWEKAANELIGTLEDIKNENS